MPRMTRQLGWAARLVTAGLLLTAGCTTTTPDAYGLSPLTQTPVSIDTNLVQLAAAIGGPSATVLSASPGRCGQTAATVVRVALPEQVLFASASDQPGPDAFKTLEDIAGKVIQRAPDAELTVLGHTDAVGSHAYNMDLSKRRAVVVLQGLAMRGLDPNRLSAVAIGKRQPIADDGTAEGRARNRRVEFFISRCLAANLAAVASNGSSRSTPSAADAVGRPAEVMRLDPSGAYGLAPVAFIQLKSPQGNPSLPAPLQASDPVQPKIARPSVRVARPAPAPHYQPRVLAPDVQRNPLGPAVPF